MSQTVVLENAVPEMTTLLALYARLPWMTTPQISRQVETERLLELVLYRKLATQHLGYMRELLIDWAYGYFCWDNSSAQLNTACRHFLSYLDRDAPVRSFPAVGVFRMSIGCQYVIREDSSHKAVAFVYEIATARALMTALTETERVALWDDSCGRKIRTTNLAPDFITANAC